jgi:4-hydroxyphenylacetate 3-monooxygenase
MVLVKNGAAHIASLRDGRKIYLDGRIIDDHTEHPAFRNAVRSAARLYDHQSSSENLDYMTFVSPRTGGRVNRMWQLPTCHADLVERRKALVSWAELMRHVRSISRPRRIGVERAIHGTGSI